MSYELPLPAEAQSYFDVSLLEAGHLFLTELEIFGDAAGQGAMYPSFSFLLNHSKSKKKFIFDLGIRKDWKAYPPQVVTEVLESGPLDVPRDIVESLRGGGLTPGQIDYICLSHLHFDHVGDPSQFPAAQFLLGQGSKEQVEHGYSSNEDPASIKYPCVAQDLLPKDRTSFLSSENWTALGPFPKAHDFLGDGSLYLVDAPGHMAGHLNALVRTSSTGAWIYLAGDSAHDVRIIRGEKTFGCIKDQTHGYTLCMHDDLAAAEEHLARIQILGKNPSVHILIAHDLEWYKENKGKGVMFPGTIPPASK